MKRIFLKIQYFSLHNELFFFVWGENNFDIAENNVISVKLANVVVYDKLCIVPVHTMLQASYP
jgi:hypothetical protein